MRSLKYALLGLLIAGPTLHAQVLKKVSQLPGLSAPTGGELVYVVDGTSNKSITVQSVMKATNRTVARLSFDDLYSSFSGDQTANIQDGLFKAQRRYFELRSNVNYLDNVMLSTQGVEFVIPRRVCITSPIVVPEKVRLVAPLGIALCDSLTGTGTDLTWTGSVTASALNNIYQPMLIVPPGGSYGDITLYPKNGSSVRTAGVAVAKTWLTTGTTLAAGGVGYTNGDVLTVGNPSPSPYLATQCTAVVSGGVVTACNQTRQGIYALPPALQTRYWTAANGYTGSVVTGATGPVGKVFENESTGAYAVTGGTGTGASVTMTFKPDFAGNGTDYDMGAYTQNDMDLGSIVVQGGTGGSSSATFGKQASWQCTGLQIRADSITTNGGYYGIKGHCTDFHVGKGLPISANVLLKAANGGSMDFGQLVLDSWDVSALEIDNYSGFHAPNCNIFHNTSWNPNTATTSPIKIGSNNTSAYSASISFRCDLDAANVMAAGQSAGATNINYLRNSRIDVAVRNSTQTGASVTNPFQSWGTIGSNVDVSNEFSGTIDKYNQTVLAGPATVPAARYNIYDVARRYVETGPTQIEINKLATTGSFGSAAWSVGGSLTRTEFAATAPDNTVSAAQLTFAASGDYLRQTMLNTSSGAKVCATAFIKTTGTGFAVQFGVFGGTNANFTSAQFTSGTGNYFTPQSGGTGTAPTYGSVDYGNGWYRIWVYGATGEANSNVAFRAPTATTGSIYVWNVQAQADPRQCPGAEVRNTVQANILVVPTTATTVAYPLSNGTLYVVKGASASTPSQQFADMVLASPGRTPVVVVNDTGNASPPARTYSMTSGALQLSIASGSGNFSITATPATQ